MKLPSLKNRLPRVSSSTSSAPAGRSSVKDTHTRNEYSGSANKSRSYSESVKSPILEHFNKVVAWSNTSMVPVFNIIIIVLFLVIALTVSLAIRTQMAALSFEQTRLQIAISKERQDLESKQAQLDALEAQLPAKAQEMGMIPQQGAITIDLSDYAKKHDDKKDSKSSSKNDKSGSKNDKSGSKNDKSGSNFVEKSDSNSGSNKKSETREQKDKTSKSKIKTNKPATQEKR